MKRRQRSAREKENVFVYSNRKAIIEDARVALKNVHLDKQTIKKSAKTEIIDTKHKKVYKVGNVLGKGAFAVCYECYESKDRTHQKYAIKRISKEKASRTSKAYGKLESEVRIHLSLQHDNICKLHAYFQEKRYVCLLLELCNRGSLQELIKKNSRSVGFSELPGLMSQLISALTYLHNRRIIHRDIKPGNVFLNFDSQSQRIIVKLGDFGLAKHLREGQKCRTICGTPNYIAPEILLCKHEGNRYGFEVDIWALGVLFFALIFNKAPFHTKDKKRTFQKIKEGSYSFPDTCSMVHERSLDDIEKLEKAKNLIERVLVCDPKKRLLLPSICSHSFFSSKKLVSKEFGNHIWLSYWHYNRKGKYIVYTFYGGCIGLYFVMDSTQIVLHSDHDRFQYIYCKTKKFKTFQLSNLDQVPRKIVDKVVFFCKLKPKVLSLIEHKANRIRSEQPEQFSAREVEEKIASEEMKNRDEMNLIFPHVVDFLFEPEHTVIRLYDKKYQASFVDKTDIYILSRLNVLKIRDAERSTTTILNASELKLYKIKDYYDKAKLVKETIDGLKKGS